VLQRVSDTTDAGGGLPYLVVLRVPARISRGDMRLRRFHERWVVAALLGMGVLARLIWSLREQNLKPLLTESHYVAVSLATTGRFANPFGVETGPTAHIGMLTPLPSAAAYWLFGVDTKAAEIALIIWAVAVVTWGFWLCWRICCVLNCPLEARLSALAFVCVIPIQFGLETVEGRSWEVNLAVALLFVLLLRLCRQDDKEVAPLPDQAVTGAILGLLFIISPPAGVAGATSVFLFQLFRRKSSRPWAVATAFTLVLCAGGAFWSMRNASQLQTPIILRDNFPLELALSNYAGAVHPDNERQAYIARMNEIHPLGFDHAVEKLIRSGGEVHYYNERGAESMRWIKSHPAAFLYLSGRRLTQFYFPPQWFWGMFGVSGKAIWLRQALVWLSSLFGGITLLIWAQRDRRYAYLLATAASSCMIYLLVQPTLRYRYLISTLLVFAAFDGAARFMRWAGSRIAVKPTLPTQTGQVGIS
jgi:hypothetical protein